MLSLFVEDPRRREGDHLLYICDDFYLKHSMRKNSKCHTDREVRNSIIFLLALKCSWSKSCSLINKGPAEGG